MLNYRVVAYGLLAGAVFNLSGCKSQPRVSSSQERPDQTQFVSSKAPQSSDEKSCHAFVQKFYDWRVSLLVDEFCSNSLKGTNATREAIENEEEDCKVASAYRKAEKLHLNQVLSPKLEQYLGREEAVRAREEDAGLDFDPYLNSQDPSPKFVVDSVLVNGNRCDAVVHGYDHGEPREAVMPELSMTNGRWVIENFHYKFEYKDGKSPQCNDLIHMIREYVGEGKYPAK